MTQRNGGNGRTVHDGEAAITEAWGASQIGPFDYTPPMGFREYWYPAILKKDIPRRKPVRVRMLGDDIVLFRGKDGKAAALTDWCPHRNARLSLGVSEFPGTITCPYHGYTFDVTGQCVAGLIDHPESPVISKMKARAYPADEYRGVVYVWMGETAAVPLEEDLPLEILDPRNHTYLRIREWDANWTEPVNQGTDYHEAYLHRKSLTRLGRFAFKYDAVIHKGLGFFRPRLSYYGGVKVMVEEEKYFTSRPKDPHQGKAYHPGVDGVFPKRTWWRILPSLPRTTDTTLRGTEPFTHMVELPSKISTAGGSATEHMHMRWMVPVDFELTRTWTYTHARRPGTIFGRAFQRLWYVLWRMPHIRRTNELEDLVTFQKGHLRYDLPQKLGPLDTGVIYFRRHLSRRSRDFQRLGGARGATKQPPTRTPAEWSQTAVEEQKTPAAVESAD